MRTFTKTEMVRKSCAFLDRPCRPCMATDCVACEQVHGEVTMEAHSGGSLRMREIANKRGRLSSDIYETRTGGEIVLRLNAEYTCRRIYPEDPV